MGNHKVRLTIHPDDTITVGDEELLDLTRMGLVIQPQKSPTPPPAQGNDKPNKEG